MKTILTLHLMMLYTLLPFFGSAQSITISGNVLNSKNGNAMESVNIFDSISNIGTITNENGYFKLVLTQGEFDLNITENGFKAITKRVMLKNDTTIVVQLEPLYKSKNQKNRNNKLESTDTDKRSLKNLK